MPLDNQASYPSSPENCRGHLGNAGPLSFASANPGNALPERDDPLHPGLFSSPLKFKIAENQRPFTVVLEKNNGIRNEKTGSVVKVGIALT